MTKLRPDTISPNKGSNAEGLNATYCPLYYFEGTVSPHQSQEAAALMLEVPAGFEETETG
jgi:hypothetical protein